jgi:hypothetical protein
LALDDTTTISGKTIASLTISPSQHLAIISDFAIGDVVQQPTPDSGTPTGVTNEAASGYTNYGVTDPANVTDNDTGTQGKFTGSDAIRVEFTPPAGPITGGLTAEVLIGASGLHASNPIYVGSENGLADIATLTAAGTSASTWYSNSQTAGLNNNYFWLWSDGLSVSSFISGVRRDYTYTAGGYQPTVTVRSDTFALELFADVDGPTAPYVYTWTVRDTCESASGWTRGVLDNSIYDVGSGSINCQPQVARYGGSPTSLSDGDVAADWTLVGSNWSLSDNTGVYTSSPSSLSLVVTASPRATTATMTCSLETSFDLTGKTVTFDFMCWEPGTQTMDTVMEFIVRRTSDGDYLMWQLDFDDTETWEDVWVTMACEIAQAETDTCGGDYTGMDEIEFVFYIETGTVVVAYRIDTIAIRDTHNLGSDICYKTFSSADYSSHDKWDFSFRRGAEEAEVMKFWLSSDTPSGNSPPANRLEFEAGITPLETWETLAYTSGTEVGSPTMSAIVSYGFTVDQNLEGSRQGSTDMYIAAWPPKGDSSLWFDQFRSGTEDASRFKAANGALIEHPADVFRHLIENVTSETVDETSVVAAETNLGSDKLAFDARGFGWTWGEIITRLGYESRANVVRLERSAGPEWGFLTASTSYTFAAASLAISQWEPGSFTFVGRALTDDLFTRFLFHYALNVSIGITDAGFTGVLRVSPSDNDISAKVPTVDLTTAESKFGAYESFPRELIGTQDASTAIDVAGYTVHEIIRRAKLFAIRGVPWYDGEVYAIEPGDIRNVTPLWTTTTSKCRVIQTIKSPATEQTELRLVEVQ